MNTINIILIIVSVMLIVYALVNLVFKCTMAIVLAIRKEGIELNLAFPCWILTISVATLVLNFLI